MQYRQTHRQSLILPVFAAISLAGFTGCQQQSENVPQLNKSSEAPAATPVAEAKPVEPAPGGETVTPKGLADEAKASAKAAEPAKVTPVAGAEKLEFRPTGQGAAAVAKDLATQLAAFEIPNAFGADHGRLVVQVNGVRNDSQIPLDDMAVTRALRESLGSNSKLVPSDKLHGSSRSGPVKAIHIALETESRALGLIPSSRLSDAPDVIVNSLVSQVGQELRLTLVAKATQTGNVFWTASKPITTSSVVVAPVSSVSAEEPAPAPADEPPAPAVEPEEMESPASK